MDIQVLALPELPSVIITLVAVFILFLVLRKFLHKPVTDFMQKRQDDIKSDIDEAEALKQEAMNLKADYEEKIEKAKLEGQEIIENSRVRASELEESMLEEAREEAKLIKDRAKKDIEREREKAYEGIKESAGEMAILIASKIMKKDINLENQNTLIDEFIDEVGDTKWQN